MRERLYHVLTALLVSAFCWLAWAQPADDAADSAESAEPVPQPWHGKTSVRLDTEKLSAVDDLIALYVDEKRVPGLVVSIAYRDEVVYTKAHGNRGLFDEQPMHVDDLFRIFSMTKPIASLALMQLYEQGKFDLDDPLTKFIPEFKDLKVYNEDGGDPTPPIRPITMLHLLTHTAGFGYVFGENDEVAQRIRNENVLGSTDLEEMATKVVDIPLRYQPGTRWFYSLAVDVQGLVIERITGLKLDEYLDQNIFEPLGMSDTFFSVPDDKFDRLLPNHFWVRQQDRLVQQPAEASEQYRNVTFFSGGGGLVSTTHDYMTFARAVANGGTLGDATILKPETIDMMRVNQLNDAIQADVGTGENPERESQWPGFAFGLGFGVVTLPSSAERSQGEYSWGGAAGTIFWIDPVEDLIVVGMIQLHASPWNLAGDLHTAVRSALVYE